MNTVASYTCKCKNGFNDIGGSCVDFNECLAENHDCYENATCLNNVGSYKCQCGIGSYGNGITCLPGSCQENVKCGSFEECESETSFNCVCTKGFERGDQQLCVDVNECENEPGCQSNSFCVNFIGGYNCTCSEGFDGDNCTDINECDTNLFECNQNQTCVNTEGSYECKCKSGFTESDSSCYDIDECSLKIHNCSSNDICRNFPGYYDCTHNCTEGYEGENCTDIDECIVMLDNCHSCINYQGGFSCICNDGFDNSTSSCVYKSSNTTLQYEKRLILVISTEILQRKATIINSSGKSDPSFCFSYGGISTFGSCFLSLES